MTGEHDALDYSGNPKPADEFVLDMDANPHPRMLAGALKRRAAADAGLFVSRSAQAEWIGYLAAMCDATGCEPHEIKAWMDRHRVDS